MNSKKIFSTFLVLGLIAYAFGTFFLNTPSTEIFLSPDAEPTSASDYLTSPVVFLVFSAIILVVIFISTKQNKNLLENIHQGKKDYKRKKILGVKERKFRISVDNLMYTLAFLGPIFSIPQVLEIIFGTSISSAAIFSWGSYTVIGFAWFVYGLIHKYKPLIIAYAIWIVIEIAVIIKILTLTT